MSRLATTSKTSRPQSELQAMLEATSHLDGHALLTAYLTRELPGEVAVASSFGAESAVLLALIAEIDPSTPVLFLDTGKLFGETRRYRDTLVATLGLTDVRAITPDQDELKREDDDEFLFQRDPDACCDLRKVRPLERALGSFTAWVNGRKRFHGATRAAIPTVELVDGRLKLTPLASWGEAEIAGEFARRNLPAHPLVADGYRSIGCYTCTARVAPDQDLRAGRWAGLQKTECGIHR
jgi:phosphoadenosine phosphosulfate reductase